jgi:16S rRNA (uracil1498-N3)-methyltransferase
MQVFYAPDIKGNTYILDEKESRHIVRVMRMSKGAPVMLIDGFGNLYNGIITDPDPKRCKISVTGVTREFEERNYRIHLAVSPLKNAERFEWMIEKIVEIGIDEITPLISHHTEKTGIREERITNIVISAMKQSLKARKPVLNSPAHFDEFIASVNSHVKLVAHCNSSVDRAKITEACPPGEDVTIMIGPEGDFSEKEIKDATKYGFISIHLGNSRLRTETAGIAACLSVYLINL